MRCESALLECCSIFCGVCYTFIYRSLNEIVSQTFHVSQFFFVCASVNLNVLVFDAGFVLSGAVILSQINFLAELFDIIEFIFLSVECSVIVPYFSVPAVCSVDVILFLGIMS